VGTVRYGNELKGRGMMRTEGRYSGGRGRGSRKGLVISTCSRCTLVCEKRVIYALSSRSVVEKGGGGIDLK
jgi:hypothetical protein